MRWSVTSAPAQVPLAQVLVLVLPARVLVLPAHWSEP
jgi:hypothetical protein